MTIGLAGCDKAWLLKLENLALVRECRRHIHSEFGVQLALDADDLLEQLFEYGQRSANPRLRRKTRLLGYRLRCAARSRGFELTTPIPVISPRPKVSDRGFLPAQGRDAEY